MKTTKINVTLVRFIINKTIVKHVQIIKEISDRIAHLVLKMRLMKMKRTLNQDISKTTEEHRNHLTLVIGCFNANLGKILN